MAKPPARSAVSRVRADDRAAARARSRRAAARSAAPEFHGWLSAPRRPPASPVARREIPGALPRNVPRDALENVAGPRRDSAVQAWIAATPRLEAPAAPRVQP